MPNIPKNGRNGQKHTDEQELTGLRGLSRYLPDYMGIEHCSSPLFQSETGEKGEKEQKPLLPP